VLPLRDRNPTTRRALVTVALVLANVGVFLLIQQPKKSTPAGELRFTYEYAAVPCEITTNEPMTVREIVTGDCSQDDGRDVVIGEPSGDDRREAFPDKNVWLSIVFSMFLHGGWLHLGGNMLFLWVFGNNIEDKLGVVGYLAFYLTGGVVAAAAHVLADPNSTIPVVGASGAVAAVMGAYLVWFPRAPILTAFIFIFIFLREIPAMWLLGFWFVLQFFTGSNSGIAWVAHVGGFVFGVLVGLALRGRARERQAVEWSVYGYRR
jgi:membrane associated rhomboid family serine protease